MGTYITDEQRAAITQALQHIVETIRDTIKRTVEALQPFLQNITDAYKREMEKPGYRLITAADIADVSERLARVRYGGAQCFHS